VTTSFPPPALIRALSQAVSLEDIGEALRLVVADTGATDHMLPDQSAFISYKSVRNLRVRMGNNSRALVLGRGTAIISLNGQGLLICNVLHVPALLVPLYSLWAHLRQPGCGFLGSHDTGMHVYFPGVVLIVDMSTDCHLSYPPLGKSAPISILHYVKPRCAPTIYPSERPAFRASSGSVPSPSLPLPDDPAIIEDNTSLAGSELLPSPVPQWAPPVPPTSFSADDLASIAQHLQVLSTKLSSLQSPPPDSSETSTTPPSRLLSTLSLDEVVRLVHRPGSVLPRVRPCDRTNGSDTTTHWTLEELHCALGCRRFRNYKHIIQASLDGQWIDGGKFPVSLGAYTTIP